jgi:glycosyltransferase involved in cell wall biosynthesis/SAM-dependent methyltransferase
LEPLHLVLPGPLEQRTGGTIYDRRMVEELRALGWPVVVHSLPASLFPGPDPRGEAALESALAALPDGARVLLDGLAAGGHPVPLERHTPRLRLLALVHHPLADETGLDEPRRRELAGLEARGLAACAGVITTSDHTADSLVADYGVPRERLRAVPPGVDPALPAVGPSPGEPPLLLCVASVTPRKGHDVLVEALATLAHLPWRCVCAGSLERDPAWARGVLQRVTEADLEERIRFPGEVDPEELDRLYHHASVFVLPSHHEGYGMALTEALVRGLPVVSTTGGAIPGTVPGGAGQLVPPGDARALALVLGGLLGGEPGGGPPSPDGGAGLREQWSRAAAAHAAALGGWEARGRELRRALESLWGEAPADADAPPAPPPGSTFDADWLTLREPVDHRSRGEVLLPLLREPWVSRGWSRVLDLGSGTGSNLRYLSPRLPGDQRWTLLDHDRTLLARVRPPSPHVEVVPMEGELATEGIEAVDQADLVTASALLDLVSEMWLRTLVLRCTAARCAVLLALSYDGSIRWSAGSPEDPVPADDDAMDRMVRDAVNRHQRRDKGTGAALGPEAGARAAALFRQAGCRVYTVESPWRLGPGDAPLALALVQGWEEAAVEEHPGEESAIRDWGRRRREALLAGRIQVTVGHLDVLALPPDAP